MRGNKKFWPVVYIGCVMRYIFLKNNTLQFNTNAQVSYKMLQVSNQLTYANRPKVGHLHVAGTIQNTTMLTDCLNYAENLTQRLIAE